MTRRAGILGDVTGRSLLETEPTPGGHNRELDILVPLAHSVQLAGRGDGKANGAGWPLFPVSGWLRLLDGSSGAATSSFDHNEVPLT